MLLPKVKYKPVKSAAMQRRDKEYLIVLLQLIVDLSFQFPISIVDEHKYAWTARGQSISIDYSKGK